MIADRMLLRFEIVGDLWETRVPLFSEDSMLLYLALLIDFMTSIVAFSE